MRGTHTLASLLARFLSRFSAFKGFCNPYYMICVPRRLQPLWLWIELASLLPVVLARMVIPSARGRVVVAERSPIDFLVWLAITLGRVDAVKSFVGRVAISLALSTCKRIVYVRADESTLMRRRRGSPEKRFIPIELRIYDTIAKALGVYTVDTTNRRVNEWGDEVLKVVSKVL